LSQAARRIRIGLVILAGALLAALLWLKREGVDETLLRILAIAAGLLVTLLFVTYRALLKMVEAARSQPPTPDVERKD
jgi:hypothetical protein